VKTLLCSLLSLFLISAQAHAENRFGVVAGVNLAKLSGDRLDGQSFGDKTGFVEGLMYQHGLNDELYLETQVRFLEKGGILGGAKTSLGYLNVPLYAKYKFTTGSGFRPFVFIGPAVGVKVSAKVGSVQRQNARNRFGAFDLSADAGLGVDYAVSETINLSLNGAYNFGLLDVASDAQSAAIGGTAIRTQGINIYASASWKL
jgi:hypothetical protein